MRFEMTDSTCALCKSLFAPVSGAYPGPSRLCGRCRQLVQTILPRNGLHTPAETTVVFGAATFIETPFAQDAKDGPAIEDGFDYREEAGAGGPSFFRPEEESYYETDLEIQPDADELDDFVEDFPGAPRESSAAESSVAESSAEGVGQMPDQGGTDFSPSGSFYDEDAATGYDAEPASESWAKVTQGYGARPAPEYLPSITTPLAGEAAHEQAQWSEQAGTIVDTAQAPDSQAPDSQAAVYGDAVTDPWDEPLPAWDYSHNEYPVLLSPKKSKDQRKLWLPIAAVLLIGLLVAAYFMLSQPGSRPPESANAQNSLVEPHGDSADAAQTLPAPATAEQQNAQAQASTNTGQEQAPTGFGSVGTLTLQSAAFPDEAGASEFSQKLIRAGVPAYVVPVDLTRKGRWFRVRVGRFTNADDAKKYAAQSRQRAKAAGMSVDFIVVEYGKP
jgi:cell division septation protein DedD